MNVQVEPFYIQEQSVPEQEQFVFAYTIEIKNEGDIPARLLTRHWIITNAHGQVYEVQGEGVVGEQPYLRPGETYKYTSSAVLDTPAGTMQGSYQMLADDGKAFEALIPPFMLAAPHSLH